MTANERANVFKRAWKEYRLKKAHKVTTTFSKCLVHAYRIYNICKQ